MRRSAQLLSAKKRTFLLLMSPLTARCEALYKKIHLSLLGLENRKRPQPLITFTSFGSCTPKVHKRFPSFSLPSPCTRVQVEETTLGIAHLGICEGKSCSGPICLTPDITVHAVYCNDMHPSLDHGEQTTIWMITCAPLTVLEVLKVLLREGMSELCPPGIVPREYEAL